MAQCGRMFATKSHPKIVGMLPQQHGAVTEHSGLSILAGNADSRVLHLLKGERMLSRQSSSVLLIGMRTFSYILLRSVSYSYTR